MSQNNCPIVNNDELMLLYYTFHAGELTLNPNRYDWKLIASMIGRGWLNYKKSDCKTKIILNMTDSGANIIYNHHLDEVEFE